MVLILETSLSVGAACSLRLACPGSQACPQSTRPRNNNALGERGDGHGHLTSARKNSRRDVVKCCEVNEFYARAGVEREAMRVGKD